MKLTLHPPQALPFLTAPPLPKLTAPPLPTQARLPFEPEYSPWFPLSRNPWQWGDYEIKIGWEGPLKIAPVRYLWDGREWADTLPKGAVAWRGLAKPPEAK